MADLRLGFLFAPMQQLINLIKQCGRRFVTGREPAEFAEIERAERIFYLEYLREGMTVFDVGANVGELTLLFSRFAPGGYVHAFEASRNTFRRLQALCDAAKSSNVVLNHLALSDENGYIQLHVYEDSLSAFNSQADRPMKKYGLDIEPVGIEEIRATTVDDYCEKNEIERIDLLKIDVEGFELQVMRGASRMLGSRSVACVTFEFGQTTFDSGNRPEEIEALLTKAGYKFRNIVERDPAFPGRESVQTARYSMHVATPA